MEDSLTFYLQFPMTFGKKPASHDGDHPLDVEMPTQILKALVVWLMAYSATMFQAQEQIVMPVPKSRHTGWNCQIKHPKEGLFPHPTHQAMLEKKTASLYGNLSSRTKKSHSIAYIAGHFTK